MSSCLEIFPFLGRFYYGNDTNFDAQAWDRMVYFLREILTKLRNYSKKGVPAIRNFEKATQNIAISLNYYPLLFSSLTINFHLLLPTLQFLYHSFIIILILLFFDPMSDVALFRSNFEKRNRKSLLA